MISQGHVWYNIHLNLYYYYYYLCWGSSDPHHLSQ